MVQHARFLFCQVPQKRCPELREGAVEHDQETKTPANPGQFTRYSLWNFDYVKRLTDLCPGIGCSCPPLKREDGGHCQ